MGKDRKKSAKKVPNPHDRVFRFVFGKPERASALIRFHLEKRHKDLLDFSRFEIFGTNVVDGDLVETDNDLVFKVGLADSEVYVFPTLEHQTSQPKRTILRMAIYALRLMEQLAPDDGGPLPLPIIIVINQGPRPWAAPTDLSGEIDLPESAEALRDFAPSFRYHVIDLPSLSDPEMCDEPAARLTLGMMKAVSEKRLLPWMKEHFGDFDQVEETDEAVIAGLFSYLINIDSEVDLESLDSLARGVQSKKLGKKIMTLAEKLEERGEKRGEERGKQHGEILGKIAVLSEIFSHQFGAGDWSATLEGLTSEECSKLAAEVWKLESADDVRSWIGERKRRS